MKQKKMKYQLYLSQYPNFSFENFGEVDMAAFRWVHKIIIDSDFLPLNLINNPPARILDDADKTCLGYGLSLFDDMDNALKGYKKGFSKYKNQRKRCASLFVKEKGDSIAQIKLEKRDGIANTPNESGHFTFFEYEDVCWPEKIKEITVIIKENEEFVI